MSTRRDFLKSGATALLASATASVAGAEVAAAGTEPTEKDHGARLDRLRASMGITGASFACWDGKTLHSAVSGLRNSVTRDPVTPDTVMHVGSITKVANATLVMQLVDDGLIRLDDPVVKHLPDLRTRDMASLSRVTCGMLINHTSGIDGEWLREYGPDQERILDTIQRCAGLGQLFPPGSATSYNNVATVIGGYLAQKLRDKSWYTLVKERIYEPLGMDHALVNPLDLPRFRTSIGDLTDYQTGAMMQTSRPFLAPSFAPAGATQMTTATDMILFARALIGGGTGVNGKRILSEASAKAMMTPTADYVPLGGEIGKVGLGWQIQPGGVVEHGGSGPGVRAKVAAHPASGRAVVLLTNCDRGDALIGAMLDPIVESWTGLAKPARPKRRALTGNAARFVGTYENNADRYVVAMQDGGLVLRTYDKISTYDNSDQERPGQKLYSLGGDLFERDQRFPGAPPMMMRFVQPGADGKAHFLADGGRLLARTA